MRKLTAGTMLEFHLALGLLSASVKELAVEVEETSSVEQLNRDLVAYYVNNDRRLVVDCVCLDFEDILQKLMV